MTYDPAIAARLVEAGVVSSTTARGWKHLGKIPDRYDTNPVRREPATPQQMEALWAAINHPALSRAHLGRSGGVSPQILCDAAAGRQALSVAEVQAMQKSIRRLKRKIAQACDGPWEAVIRLLGEEAAIKRQVLFGRGPLYYRLALAWKGRQANFSEEEQQVARAKLREMLKTKQP